MVTRVATPIPEVTTATARARYVRNRRATRGTFGFVTQFSDPVSRRVSAPTSPTGRTAVLAHRGASRAERENTLLAFRFAAEMGADGVELDVRRSADGALIVHHDPYLADGRVIIETLRSDLPVHVPSLDEALDACAGMWVNVEIKNDPNEPDFDPTDRIAETVVAVLLSRGDPERYLISSFRRETVDAVRRTTSKIPTAWLTVAVASDEMNEVLDSLVASGHSAVHPWVGGLVQELVEACHARSLSVNTWTCDDPERMDELRTWKIDAICTNVPDVALKVLGRDQSV